MVLKYTHQLGVVKLISRKNVLMIRWKMRAASIMYVMKQVPVAGKKRTATTSMTMTAAERMMKLGN